MADFYATLKSLWVVWMLGIFVAIAVWAYWPSNKKRFQDLGRIPLDDDDTTDVIPVPVTAKRKG